MEWSKYRTMWLLVMFDLPVDSKPRRRRYSQFRKFLLKDGYLMLQFSVYGRPCASEENAEVHYLRIRANLPSEGQVRILSLTDKQFERMRVFFGGKTEKLERGFAQLEMF